MNLCKENIYKPFRNPISWTAVCQAWLVSAAAHGVKLYTLTQFILHAENIKELPLRK